MKRWIPLAWMFLLVLSSSALAGASRPQGAPAEVRKGGVAPDFALETLGGETVRLADLRGKVVLLNFWATWCPPCKAEMPSMERLYEAMGGEDFTILAVNVEADVDAVREWLKANPHSFPIPMDTEAEVQELYGVYRFPETFLIGPDGTILEHYIGARDYSSTDFLRYVASLKKGE